MDDAPLHPDVAALGFLLGTWSGEGRGEYPTVKPFDYGEQIRIWHVGKPFLAYGQRTWALDDGRPLHSELGFFRLFGDRVELLLSHPSGVIEIEQGALDGTSLTLASTHVAGTPTAKPVAALERDVTVSGTTLTYAVRMAAMDLPLQPHLAAQLTRN
jgi:hypothetical protein